MRRFSVGDALDRKVVVLEVKGKTLTVLRLSPDGSPDRQEKTLATEAAAQTVADRLARELLAKGYTEHGIVAGKDRPPPAAATSRRSNSPAAKSTNSTPGPAPRRADAPPADLFDDLELPRERDDHDDGTDEGTVAPFPRRPVDSVKLSPTKSKAGKARKKKAARDPDALDKRVIAAAAVFGLLLLGGAGYMLYDAFLKPASIIGVWKGSMVEHEIGESLTHTAYSLTLDEARNASLSINDSGTATGGYSVQGNRLLLNLKDAEGDEAQVEYQIKLDRASLSLIDPRSGKLLVDLVRQFKQPSVSGEAKAKAKASTELVDVDVSKVDAEADKALASIEMGAKDGAFRLRHPSGWAPQTGGRPDNTYSYIHLERGDAKISVYADVTGALISGADSANPGDYPEGSDFAPVHKGHEHYAKTGVEEFSGYQEGAPVVFKDSGMGEGRISVFTASEGLFGGKLKGYHVTTMTRDRRVTIMAYGPEQDFAKLRPTFLAVSRSLSR